MKLKLTEQVVTKAQQSHYARFSDTNTIVAGLLYVLGISGLLVAIITHQHDD